MYSLSPMESGALLYGGSCNLPSTTSATDWEGNECDPESNQLRMYVLSVRGLI